jgi:hypothetical protein
MYKKILLYQRDLTISDNKNREKTFTVLIKFKKE